MTELTPEPIFEVASGFMAARHLFVANEVGLCEQLADGPATLEELAARTGIARPRLRILADAMVVLGFIERDGDLYQNAPVAATFLTGRTPANLRPFLRFWNRLSYPPGRNWKMLFALARARVHCTCLKKNNGYFPKGSRPFKRPPHKPSPPPTTLVATSVFWTLAGALAHG